MGSSCSARENPRYAPKSSLAPRVRWDWRCGSRWGSSSCCSSRVTRRRRRWRCTTGARRRCGRASSRAPARNSWRAAGSRRRGTPAVAAVGEAREHQELIVGLGRRPAVRRRVGGGRQRVVGLGRRQAARRRAGRRPAVPPNQTAVPRLRPLHLDPHDPLLLGCPSFFHRSPRPSAANPSGRPIVLFVSIRPTSTLPTLSQTRPRRRCSYPVRCRLRVFRANVLL